MKRNFGIALLAFVILFCCGCSASNDKAASEWNYDGVTDVVENAAYSAERSVEHEAEVAQDTAAQAIPQIPLVYANFSQHSSSTNADDGTKLFISQCSIPHFVTENEDVNKWLETYVDAAVAKTIDELKRIECMAESIYENREDGDPANFYAYSYYSNVNTARLDSSVLSVLQVNSVYSGGAHPNSAQHTYNLDLQNCTELTLSDVILPGGAEVLQEMVLTQLSGRFGSLETSGLYPDYQEVVKGCFDDDGLTSNWYFSENGLVIYFNCYDIAPYAAGIIKVEIPYDLLAGVVKATYVPEISYGGVGDIDLLDLIGERNVLGDTTEEERIFIGTNQAVYDIKLHKLTGWLTDDVPIAGSMIFASNRLTADEAIAIPATDGVEYLLNYRDGNGSVCKLVIGIDGIREIVNEIAE